MKKETIVEALLSTERPGVDKLLEHMNTIGFYTAPCSGGHHLCREGGLAEHSLNVWQFGLTSLRTELLGIDFREWKIVSLLHDLGKACYRNKPNYVPNILKSGLVSKEKPWSTNKDRLYIPHEVVSVIVASEFIELTDEEEFAIMYHNGMYTALGKEISGKERPLQQLLHFADMWCSRFIESEEKE